MNGLMEEVDCEVDLLKDDASEADELAAPA